MRENPIFNGNYNRDVWLRESVATAIDQKCTPSIAAERIGISKSTAVEYYKKIMLENSFSAIHDKHGKVFVYSNEGWDCHFIFDFDSGNLIGSEKFGEENFKFLSKNTN